MEQYEYTPLHYGTPCQVKFYEGTFKTYMGGIAFEDEIICGCCGGIFHIEDVVACAEADGINSDEAIIELDWIDISENIKGE